MVGYRPISGERPLVLASASPRRRELLARAGVPLEVRPGRVDESLVPGEPPDVAVRRLAQGKAAAAGSLRRWVLGADTLVVCDGAPLGKPRDAQDATQMLRSLADREHRVLTGVCLLDPAASPVYLATVATRVRFRALDDDEIRDYVASSEPFGKAGGYAIQGIGAALVLRVSGSYTNVVGLPLAEVIEALRRHGALAAPSLAAGAAALEGRG